MRALAAKARPGHLIGGKQDALGALIIVASFGTIFFRRLARMSERRFDNNSISDRVAFVKLPVITAVETTFGKAKRSRAYRQAMAKTALITATPAIKPCGSLDGLVSGT